MLVQSLHYSITNSKKLTHFMLGNFSCFFLSSTDFLKINVFQNKLRNAIRVSNGLEPDQGRHFVGPDLGPNCLHLPKVFSRRQKLPLARKKLVVF